MNGRHDNCLTRNCIHRCTEHKTSYCLQTGELIEIKQGTKVCQYFDSQANYTPQINYAEKDRYFYWKEYNERKAYGL